jgi:hypothetical protein
MDPDPTLIRDTTAPESYINVVKHAMRHNLMNLTICQFSMTTIGSLSPLTS